jgi:PAS domain-containing protein
MTRRRVTLVLIPEVLFNVAVWTNPRGLFRADATLRTDLTPLGFVATGVLFAVGFYRYQILDVVPVARSTVIDNIDEGYIVFDPDNVVIDVNETAVAIIGAPERAILGASFSEIFSDYPKILDRFEDARDTHGRFGLSIVETAARAHGWTFEVTEGESGGARFEFRGVGDSPVTEQ